MTRRFLFLIGHSLQDSLNGKESLDALLTVAAFEQSLSVVFLDEGVDQLIGQGCTPLESSLLDLLKFYDVESVWIERESLRLSLPDDCRNNLPATLIPRADIPSLIARHDRVLVV